jgi:hypothetical protein
MELWSLVELKLLNLIVVVIIWWHLVLHGGLWHIPGVHFILLALSGNLELFFRHIILSANLVWHNELRSHYCCCTLLVIVLVILQTNEVRVLNWRTYHNMRREYIIFGKNVLLFVLELLWIVDGWQLQILVQNIHIRLVYSEIVLIYLCVIFCVLYHYRPSLLCLWSRRLDIVDSYFRTLLHVHLLQTDLLVFQCFENLVKLFLQIHDLVLKLQKVTLVNVVFLQVYQELLDGWVHNAHFHDL